MATVSLALLVLFALTSISAAAPPPSEDINCPRQCTCDVFTDVVQADCSSQSLTAIPTSLHSSTNKLILDDNILGTLSSGAFRSLVNLKDFYCSSCQLESIDDDAFDGLSSLKFIDLSLNNFQDISTEPFKKLKKLRVLIINGNEDLDCDKVVDDFYYVFPRVFVECDAETTQRRKRSAEDDELSLFFNEVFNSTQSNDVVDEANLANNTRSLTNATKADGAGGEWVPVDTPEDPGGWGAGTYVVLAVLVLIICLVCFKFVFLRLRKKWKRRAREAAWRAQDEEDEEEG